MNRVKNANRLFLALILTYFVGIYGLSFINSLIDIPYALLQVLVQAVIILPGVVYYIVTKTNPIRFARYKKLKILDVLMCVLFAYTIIPLTTLLNLITMLFSTNYVADATSTLMAYPYLLNLVIIAVVPAFVEEFLFRGIFYNSYRKKSILVGAAVSGLLFGLMHMNINQFSYAFVLGIFLAVLLEATGSIIAPMIVHFTINATSITLSTIIDSVSPISDSVSEAEEMLGSVSVVTYYLPSIVVYTFLALGGTACAVCIIVWLANRNGNIEQIRNIFKRKEINAFNQNDMNVYIDNQDNTNQQRFVTIPLVIGVLLCAAYMIATEVMA